MASSFVVILVCLLLSAFFSGMEIAFVSANRFRIEIDRKRGDLAGNIMGRLHENPTKFISAMLVGNNITLVVYGIMMAGLLDPPLQSMFRNEVAVLFLQTLISTIIVLITAEFLPKAIFRADPNGMLRLFALPAQAIYTLLRPVVWITDTFSRQVLTSIFKVKMNEEKLSFGRSDLDDLVNDPEGRSKQSGEAENEIKILRNALVFNDLKVRQCMIPRTEMVSVDIDITVEELRTKFVETGLSKIIIYRETVDDIAGYIHSFDMFQRPTTVRSVLRPISFVPETMKVQDLLKQFGQQQRSMAVVVDEFGGTAGLVTVEDIVEELFGEIEDEHDTEELVCRKLSDREFQLSARLEIDRLNSDFDLDLQTSDEYETLGGYIIAHHGSIPKKDETLTIGRFSFTITAVESTRVAEVKLRLLD